MVEQGWIKKDIDWNEVGEELKYLGWHLTPALAPAYEAVQKCNEGKITQAALFVALAGFEIACIAPGMSKALGISVKSFEVGVASAARQAERELAKKAITKEANTNVF